MSDLPDPPEDPDPNVSQPCDAQLREVARREQECRWRLEHAAFIAAYNSTTGAEGLPLDPWRMF